MLATPRDLILATIRLYRANFWLMIGYAAWILLPLAIVLIVPQLALKSEMTMIIMIPTTLVELFVLLWVAICLMRAVTHLSKNEAVDPAQVSREALKRIQPVLVIAILQIFIVVGGFLLLVIPAVVFFVWYAFAQPAAAIDQKRPMEALSSSRTLVAGRFFPVLWRLITGPIIIMLVYTFLLGLILFVFSLIFGVAPEAVFAQEPPMWARIIDTIAQVFVLPLYIIYATLVYLDLKKTKTQPLDEPAPVA